MIKHCNSCRYLANLGGNQKLPDPCYACFMAAINLGDYHSRWQPMEASS